MRTLSLLVSGLVLSAALTGCGGDEQETDAGPSTAPPAPAPSPSPSPSSSSAPPSAPAAAPAPSQDQAATAPVPAASEVRLTGDGLDLPEQALAFGTTFGQAASALEAALGEPTLDSGEGESFSNYGTCPGTRLRALEYGDGALYVLFGDVEGQELTMYQWSLTPDGDPASVPQASALFGDSTTFEFGIGTTVAELQEGAAPDVEVNEGDEIFGPSFTLQDQSSGFFGSLTGTGPANTVTFVQGGEGCGE